MAGPWENYQQQPAPWLKYQQQPEQQSAAPWEKYKQEPQTAQSALAPQPQGPAPVGSPSNPILIQDMARQAVKPITDIPSEYSREIEQTTGQMRRSVGQLVSGKPMEMLKGAGNLALGGAGYLSAPISAPLRTIVGKPIENVTGSPAAGGVAELLAGLALPGVGIAGQVAKARAPLDIAEMTAKQQPSMWRRLFSPGTVSPQAKEATTLLRTATGTAARDYEIGRAALQQHERQVNMLPPQSQVDLLNYMERRSSGAQIPDPALQSFADEFRTAMKQRRQKIESSGRFADANMLEDYVTHYWKDPAAARVFVNKWMSKQGSSRSLRKRVVPTIADGIAAGLEPLTTNPIQIGLRYMASMDKYIAMNEMIDAGRSAGSVKFFRPGSRNIPDGWTELQGHIPHRNTPVGEMRAYAPSDWARIWNNHVSSGISGDWREAYDTFRRASNMTTQTILGLSGYHGVAMAKHAIHSDFARAISQVVGGLKNVVKGAVQRDGAQILRGALTFGKGVAGNVTAPIAFVNRAIQGKKFQQIYLGRVPGSPDFRRLADLYTQAGGRAVGKGAAIDYEFSRAGSFFSAWRRASLKHELRQGLQEVRDAKNPLLKGVSFVTDTIGRAFDTISEPLFGKYIPLLKNGVFADTMRAWMEANPQSTAEQQLQVAQRIVDSIDNRLGEMINDNIMWSTTAKQVASIGMLSYSWNIGKIREILGGAAAGMRNMGRGLDIASPDYDPRVAYVVAFPMVMATANSIYQYLKTGKPPQSPADLMTAPQTGGTTQVYGGAGPVPERALLPGDEKEIFGWYNIVGGNEPLSQELYNKANPLIRLGVDFMRQKDWADRPFVPPNPNAPQWLQAYFQHAVEGLGPIGAQRLSQGEKRGSGMGLPEEILGIREAPKYLEDPSGYARGRLKIERGAWQRKQRGDIRQQRQYQGAQE